MNRQKGTTRQRNKTTTKQKKYRPHIFIYISYEILYIYMIYILYTIFDDDDNNHYQ